MFPVLCIDHQLIPMMAFWVRVMYGLIPTAKQMFLLL